MPQADLAQVLVYSMLDSGLFFNAIKLQKYLKYDVPRVAKPTLLWRPVICALRNIT